MASIEKRGDGYQIRWWSLRKCHRSHQAPTLRVANQIAREIEEQKARGIDWAPAGLREDPPLDEVTRLFLSERADHLRASTIRNYAVRLDLFLRFLRERHPRGPLGASLLSRPMLNELFAWLRKPETGRHGHRRGAESAARVVEVVQLFWTWAEGSERWPDIPRPRTIDLPKSDPQPVVAPTWAEMDACVAACNGWQRRLALWLRYTGLRVGESMLFLWSDIDMIAGTLTIRPEVNKTGAGRIVPLSPHLISEIAGWGKREGYVIPTGRKPGKREREPRPRDIKRAWTRAKVRPEAARQPDHAFRRGWKTGMLALGAHPDAVDYLQGHALGTVGGRRRYIDPWQALPLVETAARVPAIGDAAANVRALRDPSVPATYPEHGASTSRSRR